MSTPTTAAIDSDGIPIPPKFIRQRGKMVYNPDYISYMKGEKNPNKSTKEESKILDVITDIVDLSEDFPYADQEHPMRTLRWNPGARWIYSNFGEISEVYRVTVVEDGKLVADYRKDGVGEDDTFNLFSTTKGIMSMLIGVVMERTDLTPQDTLEKVFENNPNAWTRLENSPEELEYTKSITIHELLTMTSGLVSMIGGLKGVLSMKAFSVPDAAGSDLARALEAPSFNPKLRGTFHYMPSSNILSYVIKEKTGLSPLEFAHLHVFPKLGIRPHKMNWEANSEGIQASYSQLYLTTYQLCKIGQLYLQDGFPSPKALKPLFDDDWIDLSHQKHVYAGQGGFDHWYGYLWSHYDRDYHSNLQAGDIWCAPGFNGQLLAISRDTNRVVAISRFPKPMDGDTLVHFKQCAIKLLGKTMSYQMSGNDGSESDGIGDSASSLPDGPPRKYIRQNGAMVLNQEYVDYMKNEQSRKTTGNDE